MHNLGDGLAKLPLGMDMELRSNWNEKLIY